MVKFNHFLSVPADHLAQIHKSHENREPILKIELQDESVFEVPDNITIPYGNTEDPLF